MTHMLYEVFLPETESCRDSAGRAWLRFTIKGEVLFVKKKKNCCRSSNTSPSSSFGTLLKASFHIRKKHLQSFPRKRLFSSLPYEQPLPH